MKKYLFFAVAAIMLAACGGNPPENNGGNEGGNTKTAQELALDRLNNFKTIHNFDTICINEMWMYDPSQKDFNHAQADYWAFGGVDDTIPQSILFKKINIYDKYYRVVMRYPIYRYTQIKCNGVATSYKRRIRNGLSHAFYSRILPPNVQYASH